MKHESLVNRIASAIFSQKIAVRENLFYDAFKGSLDFADDDIPNWRAVQAIVGGGGSPVAIPIGTPLTSGYVQVAYTPYAAFGDNPRKWVEIIVDANTTEQIYIMIRNVYVTGTLTYINVYAADDGTGHTLDDLRLIIS